MEPLVYQSDSVLDESVIEELESLGGGSADGEEPIMKALLHVFEKTVMETVSLARHGASVVALNEVAESVHKLKGSSGSMGALALFNCCREVDKRLKGAELGPSDLNPCVEIIALECQRAISALHERVGD